MEKPTDFNILHLLALELNFASLIYTYKLAYEVHHNHLNLTQVSHLLHIDQPKLSHAVRNVEQKLQVHGKKEKLELFNRKKSLQLTKAGQRFLQDFEPVLQQFLITIDNVQKTDQGENGQIIFGITSSVTNNILSGITRLFKEVYPNVRLIGQEMTTKRQIQALHYHQIDIGLLHLPASTIDDKEIQYEKILKEPWVILLPEDHRLAKFEKISLSNIKNEGVILPSHESAPGLFQAITNIFKRQGLELNVIQEAAHTQTILALVRHKIGIAILPSNAKIFQYKGVVYREVEEKEEISSATTDMAWRKSDESSQLLENFRKVVKEISELYCKQMKMDF